MTREEKQEVVSCLCSLSKYYQRVLSDSKLPEGKAKEDLRAIYGHRIGKVQRLIKRQQAEIDEMEEQEIPLF